MHGPQHKTSSFRQTFVNTRKKCKSENVMTLAFCEKHCSFKFGLILCQKQQKKKTGNITVCIKWPLKLTFEPFDLEQMPQTAPQTDL